MRRPLSLSAGRARAVARWAITARAETPEREIDRIEYNML